MATSSPMTVSCMYSEVSLAYPLGRSPFITWVGATMTSCSSSTVPAISGSLLAASRLQVPHGISGMHVSLAVNILTKCMPGKSASMHCITGCQLRVFMTFAASQMMTAAYDVYHARSCATWAMSVCLPCVSCLQLRCMGHAYNVYHACSCAA